MQAELDTDGLVHRRKGFLAQELEELRVDEALGDVVPLVRM